MDVRSKIHVQSIPNSEEETLTESAAALVIETVEGKYEPQIVTTEGRFRTIYNYRLFLSGLFWLLSVFCSSKINTYD